MSTDNKIIDQNKLLQTICNNITQEEIENTRANIEDMKNDNGDLLSDSICLSGGLVMIAYD